MPSAFPGMDPYLEAQGLWESFHAAMVTHSAELLNQNLPEGYVAQIETSITLLNQEIPGARRIPDVLVAREPDVPTAPIPSRRNEAGVVTIEPVTLPLAMGEVELRERWIEISSVPELDLVTVIEILSPANKAGSGRAEYPRKRAAMIERPVGFVEIDLLLDGRRTPIAGKLPAGDYYAVVARTAGRPNAEVYAWAVRQTLPVIPIPLRDPDLDATLNLQEAFDLTYDRGRYRRLLRYGSPLPAIFSLSKVDREWCESLRV